MQLLANLIRVTAPRGVRAIKDAAIQPTIWFTRTFGRPGRGGIRRRLAISSICMVLPCILAAHVAFSAYARINRQEAKAQIEAEAIDLNHLIAREIAHIRRLGIYLAQIEPLLRDDPDRMKSIFAAALTANPQQDLHIVLADASGQQLLNTRAPAGTVLPPLADQAGVELVVKARHAVFRHVSRGNVSSRSLYTVLVPILRDGVVERIIGLNRTTDHLLALIDQQLPSASWRVTVFDDIGRVMLTTAPDAIRAPAVRDLAPGVPLTVTEENGSSIISYLKGKGADWTVAVIANYSVAAMNQWLFLLKLQIGAVFLSIGIAWWTARGIIRPIVHLEELAKTFESSAKRAWPVLKIREIQHAAETLMRTATALRQSREQLAGIIASASDAIICVDRHNRITLFNDEAVAIFECSKDMAIGRSVEDFLATSLDSVGLEPHTARIAECIGRRSQGEEFAAEVSIARPVEDDHYRYSIIVRDITTRQRVAAEHARMAIVVASSVEAIVGLDSHGIVTTWNPAARTLFGYSSDEILGRSLNVLLPEEEMDTLEDKLRRVRVSGPARVEVERKRKDGTRVFVSVAAAPICNSSASSIGFVVVYRDITERKRYEQQMRIVMRELSHRAKNLLAVIAAMARSMTTSGIDITTFVDDLSARIHGLARSHDLLVKKEWVDASMRSLVEAQLQPFVFKSNNKLSIHGDDIALSPAAAQMIGLALHELATNATKHGSFSSATGVVSVSWAIDTDDAGLAYFALTWQESGGPSVTVPSSHGFGREVLEEMLAESLDGSTRLGFAESGVVWALRTRLSVVQAAVIPDGAGYGMVTLTARSNRNAAQLAA